MDTSPTSPLQIVVCAAGMVTDVGKLITAAHEWHWDVEVIAPHRDSASLTWGG